MHLQQGKICVLTTSSGARSVYNSCQKLKTRSLGAEIARLRPDSRSYEHLRRETSNAHDFVVAGTAGRGTRAGRRRVWLRLTPAGWIAFVHHVDALRSIAVGAC